MPEEISIGIVDAKSLPDVFKIWDLSFGSPYSIESVETYVNEHLSLLLAAFHNGKAVAVSALIDFEIHFDDRWIRSGGIAGVATHPSYRRQGLTKKLLRACLQHLYDKRVPLSTLWPFSYQFYERLGWNATNLQYKIEQSMEHLPKGGKARNYQEIPSEEHRLLFALHEQWSEGWNLSIRRNEKRWERMLSLSPQSWLLFKHKEGYMLINLKDAEQGTFRVREWCYLSDEAFLDGLALLSQMDSQFNRVGWLSGETDSLLKLGIPQQPPKIEMLPGMMSRVVHPEAFAELLPNKLDGLKIVDPLGIANTEGPGEEIGPGELVQLATGFFQGPFSEKYAKHFKIAGAKKAFSIEKY